MKGSNTLAATLTIVGFTQSTNPVCYEELDFQPRDSDKHTIVISNKGNRFKVDFELVVVNDTGLLESDEPE